MTTLNLQIATGDDDADQEGTSVTLGGANMNLDPGEYGAFRFPGVAIPSLATIDAATFSVYAQYGPIDDLYADVHAEAADDSAALAATSNNISDRARTTAKVNISQSNTDVGWQAFPDCKAVIQEVIDRGGWSSGQALTMILVALTNCYFRLRTYDGDPTYAAKLDVTFTEYGSSRAKRRMLRPGTRAGVEAGM